MSHPNPYLFQISRILCKLEVGWIFQQVCVHVAAGCFGFKGEIIYVWLRCLCDLCMNVICCINIHSYVIYVVNFNVSSTNINARARLSRYVWYGCYNWYQSRSIQTVPWVIKLQLT
jgi:hypothetical protein